MDLSIIIVNWNSKDYLQKCIASILSATSGIKFEIVVIDGASFDGCNKMLRQHYPNVKFIQSERNVGFAKANNEAFKASRGRNILFLNPDTEIEGDAVQTLLRSVESLPDAGVLGARLLNTDRTVQTSCIRAFPTILSETLDVETLRYHFPHSRLWGMAPLYKTPENPVEVDAVSGACMMLRRSIFERVGMFSTDYFMYSEDIDLCFKVVKSGFKNYFVPTSIVVHHGGVSSEQSKISTFSSVMIVESLWRFFVNNRSLWCGWLYRGSIMAVSAMRIFIAALLWRLDSKAVRHANWKLAGQKGLAQFRWALGLESWVKDY